MFAKMCFVVENNNGHSSLFSSVPVLVNNALSVVIIALVDKALYSLDEYFSPLFRELRTTQNTLQWKTVV